MTDKIKVSFEFDSAASAVAFLQRQDGSNVPTEVTAPIAVEDTVAQVAAHVAAHVAPTTPAEAAAAFLGTTADPLAAPVAPLTMPAGELDANGMAWNADYNTAAKAKTAKGVWKTAPGKAPIAAAAIEAHNASGGNVPAPTTPAPTMPAPTMPALPVADTPVPVADTPAPVAAATPDATVAKLTELFQARRLVMEDYQSMMARHGIVGDVAAFLQVNPNVCTAVMAELSAL